MAKIITKLTEFLELNSSELVEVTHLYLANSNLSLFLTAEVARQFYNQLRLCQNLKHLNLQHNGLSFPQLQEIQVALRDTPQVQINSNDNPMLGAPTTRRTDTILELLDVAEYLHNIYPEKTKFHRFSKKSKLHIWNSKTDQLTNMTMSALVLSDGKIVILYPNRTEYVPNKFVEYRKVPEHAGQGIKLGFIRSNNAKEIALVMIKTALTDASREVFQDEAFFAFRTHHYIAGIKRPYTYKSIIRNAISASSQKHYLMTKFHGLLDAFDHIVMVLDTPIQTDAYLLNAFGLMLAVVSCHINGFVHLDVKPENCIYVDNMAILIDPGSAHLLANNELNYTQCRVSTRYAPTELLRAVFSHGQITVNATLDYFAAATVIREILYPVTLRVGSTAYFNRGRDAAINKALDKHFAQGIAKHYGADVSTMLMQLIDHNPANRGNFLIVLQNMACKYLDIFDKAINARFKYFFEIIQEKMRLHPEVRSYIETTEQLEFLKDPYSEKCFSIHACAEQILPSINLLCRLEVTAMYLQLEPLPHVLESIVGLWQQPDKAITELDHQYYCDPQLEREYAKNRFVIG